MQLVVSVAAPIIDKFRQKQEEKPLINRHDVKVKLCSDLKVSH